MCFIEQQDLRLFSSWKHQHQISGRKHCLQENLSHLNTLHSMCSRLSILSSSANMSSKRFFWACMTCASNSQSLSGHLHLAESQGHQQLELYRVGDVFCTMLTMSLRLRHGQLHVRQWPASRQHIDIPNSDTEHSNQ